MNLKSIRQSGKKYLLILLIWLIPVVCFAKMQEDDLSYIKTPQDLVNWLANNFEYVWEVNDIWPTPKEIIKAKKGDCEDFAILASNILNHLGIINYILIIKFEKLNVGHAICIWQDEDGNYKFISNQKLFNTGKSNFKEVIDKYYPDWETITFTDLNKNYIKTITKKAKTDVFYKTIQTAFPKNPKEVSPTFIF